MNVSRLTALEIYGNQEDIICRCEGKNRDGLFIGIIRRGPGYNGKVLIDVGLKVKSAEDAVFYMETLRDSIVEAMEKELSDLENETVKLLEKPDVKVALEVAKVAKDI